MLIQRFIDGDSNPLGQMMTDESGTPRDLAQIMIGVHSMNERWLQQNRGKPFAESIKLAESIRAKTHALIAQLTEAQLATRIPLAPWGGGTIGGILAANCSHASMHINWLKSAA